ncbi:MULTISPECIES: hypothetical protein [unclassified Tolypothrix]|uniref:hypothetical protein n=1 Tax=unclassified Tolypothrix TaxID=2649714 RepID=UPI0005EAB944|nr:MULTISPECIES: hypothetical protein [unclassified Tolypothrix]BAY89706.1 hypothetical protein NIES3275_17090 [Microchaete diplosiphon NIES-3275]EKE97585.1 hypothetical protein FDUTEX481_04963 [Tolypothrix sp. PCC 7601]MBE9083182.1 hypothetical protein [Tolypothrix sp. LEGE 11397]UYD23970.1 hypothetical protein HGR01_20965 [Tolypothrix sp. PCC 7712]UYD33802.1 hypothetical protein HG267_33775 [Tolypothrix sp. PCC 7601]
MKNLDNFDDSVITESNDILEKLRDIILQLKAVPNNYIDVSNLDNLEQDLQNILPQLQFALLNAQEEKNWQQVNKLREAVRECKDTLNSVRAAIIRATIIGINPANLAEMQKILQEIKSNSQTQSQVEYIVYVLRFMRKLFM